MPEETKDKLKIRESSKAKDLIKNPSTYSFEKVDILKVGHYGSKTSTEKVFLKHINPKIALVSSREE